MSERRKFGENPVADTRFDVALDDASALGSGAVALAVDAEFEPEVGDGGNTAQRRRRARQATLDFAAEIAGERAGFIQGNGGGGSQGCHDCFPPRQATAE